MRVLPVKAPAIVAFSDLDDRVSGLVDQADLIVTAKFEAEHKAAEEAARAVKAAQQKAVADPASGGVKPDGGCLGKHHGT
jgi:hypothetical protein